MKRFCIMIMLFWVVSAYAQTPAHPDTIFTNYGDTILCTIGQIKYKSDGDYLEYYSLGSLKKQRMPLNNVHRYSKAIPFKKNVFDINDFKVTDTVQLKEVIIDLTTDITNLKKDIERYNSQMNTGTLFIFSGYTLALLVSPLFYMKEDPRVSYALVGVGTLLGSIGFVIHIDAKKHISGKSSKFLHGGGLVVQ